MDGYTVDFRQGRFLSSGLGQRGGARSWYATNKSQRTRSKNMAFGEIFPKTFALKRDGSFPGGEMLAAGEWLPKTNTVAILAASLLMLSWR